MKENKIWVIKQKGSNSIEKSEPRSIEYKKWFYGIKLSKKKQKNRKEAEKYHSFYGQVINLFRNL